MSEKIHQRAEVIRNQILQQLPLGSVSPDHTPTQHFYKYQGIRYPSVTTKTDVIKQGHLKDWAVRLAAKHAADNYDRVGNGEYDFVVSEACSAANDIRDRAGDIGNQAHNAIEDWLNHWISTGQKPQSSIEQTIIAKYPGDLFPEAKSCAIAADRFFQDNYIWPIWSELLVVSPQLGVAGTLDFLALVGEEVSPSNQYCPQHDMYSTSLTKVNKYNEECIHCGLRVDYQLQIIDWKTSNSIDNPKYLLQVSAYKKALTDCTKLKAKGAGIVRLDKKNATYDARWLGLKKINQAKQYYEKVSALYDWLESGDSDVKEPAKIMKL